jgi:peptide/nickel transport system permease protein
MKSVSFTPRFYVAATVLAIILLIAIFGPMLVRTDPNATVGGLYDEPAGWGPLLLGTDNEGQSVIANLVYGTRTSLIVGLVAGTIATVIGLAIGLIAGFQGGLVDNLLSSLTNIFLVIPVIIVVILLSVALDNRSIFTLAFVIGICAWPWLARAVRAQTISVRTREHIDVAMMSGASFWSILLRDVLPYLLSYVVMAFVLQVSGAILFESTLSMLGLGPSNAVSLGVMLYWAIAWGSVRTGAWWAFVPPTLMLTIISFSLLLLQSSLDELFNPRLRRGKIRRKKGVDPRFEVPAAEGPAPQLTAAGVVEGPAPVQEPKREGGR